MVNRLHLLQHTSFSSSSSLFTPRSLPVILPILQVQRLISSLTDSAWGSHSAILTWLHSSHPHLLCLPATASNASVHLTHSSCLLSLRKQKGVKQRQVIPKVNLSKIPPRMERISIWWQVCTLYIKECKDKTVFSALQNLLDSRSLKFIVRLTLHDRTTKSLLHLHKKKKPPSISAQFQVSLTSYLACHSYILQSSLNID